MRWVCPSAAVLMGIAGLPLPAAEITPTNRAAYPSYGGYAAISAPACGAPMGFALAPGCCECPPDCCDNAWAGYCQQKARWQAFWSRIGLPKARTFAYTAASMEPPEPAGQCVRLPPAGEPQIAPLPPSEGNLEPLPPIPPGVAAPP